MSRSKRMGRAIAGEPRQDAEERVRRHILGQLHSHEIDRFELIRSKDRVWVFRCSFDGSPTVIKYFEKDDDMREIHNYQLLHRLGIPTMDVLEYAQRCLVLEDIAESKTWRLGIPDDLRDEQIAGRLAEWYFHFHEKGINIPELPELYCETDCLTIANLNRLSERDPSLKDITCYLQNHVGLFQKELAGLVRTLNYNDFYWTNMLVRKDHTAAMMFDYNYLGQGYRGNDISNVKSSLSVEAGTAFEDQYDMLYHGKYGVSRECERQNEERITSIVTPLITVILAYQKPDFPAWGEEARQLVLSPQYLEHVKSFVDSCDK